MHHHDRHVLIAFHRDLILHVHLVDGDLAAGRRRIRAEPRLRNRLVLAAHEKASLFLDRERTWLILRLPGCRCGDECENDD